MKTRVISYSIVAAAVFVVLSLLLVSIPAAQNAAPARTVATPRLPDGRSNFSGYYAPDRSAGDPVEEVPGRHILNRLPDGSVFFDYAGANQAQLHVPRETDYTNAAPYKPEYLAKVKEIAATAYGGTTALDPVMDCKPNGVPRAGISGLILHTPEALGILYEASPGPYYRIIYTDGRKHPDNFDSSYFGHSLGHWEGDTLVVDTIGLNDETWLGGGQGTANLSTIHSDQLHVIERFSRSGDTLTVQTTAEDPVMFTKPWVMETRTARINRTGDYMQPQMCSHQSVGGKNRKEHFVQESEKG